LSEPATLRDQRPPAAPARKKHTAAPWWTDPERLEAAKQKRLATRAAHAAAAGTAQTTPGKARSQAAPRQATRVQILFCPECRREVSEEQVRRATSDVAMTRYGGVVVEEVWCLEHVGLPIERVVYFRRGEVEESK
jgi:hypothetical protein